MKESGQEKIDDVIMMYLQGEPDKVYQWRNSYGLSLGKPAGTRAEGAPEGCPFTLVLHLKLPFE